MTTLEEKMYQIWLYNKDGHDTYVEGSRLFTLIYKKLQRETHFSGKQMRSEFPAFYSAWQRFKVSAYRDSYCAAKLAQHILSQGFEQP